MVVAPEQPPNLFWISTLRVLAAAAVVILHTSHIFVTAGAKTALLDWWLANGFESALRWCVPVFVLVSGALLLDPERNEDLLAFARKRAGRVLAPLVFWTVVYLAWRLRFEGLALRDIPRLLLEGIPYYHLWYLFMIPGLYLFTPFLRTYIRSSTDRERWYLVYLLLTLAGVEAYITYFHRPDTQSFVTLFLPYLAYYLCGYQMRTLGTRRVAPALLLAGLAACAAVTAAGTGLLVQAYGISNKAFFFYDYLSPPAIVSALLVFQLARQSARTPRRLPAWLSRAIAAIAPATLGIYVIHPLLLAILQQARIFDPTRLAALPAIPLLAMAAFVTAYLLTALLQRVPLLRETVG